MSLLICPECNHEVSTAADACPNCGLRMRPPVVEKRVLVTQAASENSFPPWAIAATTSWLSALRRSDRSMERTTMRSVVVMRIGTRPA